MNIFSVFLYSLTLSPILSKFLDAYTCSKNDYIKYILIELSNHFIEKQGPQIRIVGGHSEGTVEVFINGTWGSICQRSISNKEADVICQQLNYTYGTHSSSSDVPVSTGPVLIDQMFCTGKEANIFDCQISINTDPHSSCSQHRYDMVVKCYSNGRLFFIGAGHKRLVKRFLYYTFMKNFLFLSISFFASIPKYF